MNLTTDSKIYTANVYLVTGDWNRISDVNTLIDVGRDMEVMNRLTEASTGIGKRKVEQVILTHAHYDHVSILGEIIKNYHPKVYAYSDFLEGVDHVIKGGEILQIGDRFCEVIHTPGHSSDSICLYCEEEKALFSGDTPLLIYDPKGSYEKAYIQGLERICRRDIETVYFGHGVAMRQRCNKALHESLKNVRAGRMSSKTIEEGIIDGMV